MGYNLGTVHGPDERQSLIKLTPLGGMSKAKLRRAAWLS